jgi:hypothetical protein
VKHFAANQLAIVSRETIFKLLAKGFLNQLESLCQYKTCLCLTVLSIICQPFADALKNLAVICVRSLR